MYSERQIKLWFKKIRNDSYSDLCLSSKVHIELMGFTGYSSPFTGDVYINLDKINNSNYTKDGMVGLIAHELAHQVSYRKRSFIGKWIFLWNYYFSLKKRCEVEKEADEITIQRGYGKELISEITSEYEYYSDDREMLKFIKKVYSTPNDIKRLIRKYSKK